MTGGHVILGAVPGIDFDVDDSTTGHGRSDTPKSEPSEGDLLQREGTLLLGSRSGLGALWLVFC